METEKSCCTVVSCCKWLATKKQPSLLMQVTVYKEDRGFTLSSYYLVVLVADFLRSFICTLFSIPTSYPKSHHFYSKACNRCNKTEILLWCHLYSIKSCCSRFTTVFNRCNRMGVLA